MGKSTLLILKVLGLQIFPEIPLSSSPKLIDLWMVNSLSGLEVLSPNFFDSMPNLQALALDSPHLKRLPMLLWKLYVLRILLIWRINEELLESILQLPKLKRLWLFDCKFTHLHEFLGKMSSINSMVVADCDNLKWEESRMSSLCQQLQ